MSKSIYYRQCALQNRNQELNTWIPEKFAILQKILKLKDKKGNWSDGWKVIRVWQHRLEESMLPDSHQDIKGHRKATGDSELKIMINKIHA